MKRRRKLASGKASATRPRIKGWRVTKNEWFDSVKRVEAREMRCLFSPEGREKALLDEFLHQAVVIELLGLRLPCFGIFLAALVQSHLNGFALDQRNFFYEVVGVLHGAFEHGRIRDLGVAGNNRLRLLFAGVHEMNCFSVSAHK